MLGLKSNHRHLCLGVASWFEKSLADGFAKQPHSHYLEPAGPSSHGRTMATLEELEETAQLMALSHPQPQPLTETQIDELRQTFGARW